MSKHLCMLPQLLMILLYTGCSSAQTQVEPGRNDFAVSAQASKEANAAEAAIEAANEHCEKQSKRAIPASAPRAVFAMDHDYKVVMRFKCE